jgi:hypothetical protein
MSKTKQTNQTLDANKLIDAIVTASAEAQRASLTTLFAALGIAQIQSHPASVPTAAPAVTRPTMVTSKLVLTRPTAQNESGMILVPVTPDAPATIAEAMNRHDARKGKSSGLRAAERITEMREDEDLNEPDFGDGHCRVGKGNGGTKLPKAIFTGYDGVILRMPNGEEHTIRTDVEGRGKLTLKQTDDIGAYRSEGHFLVFIRDAEYGNVYEVIVWSGRKTVPATRRAAPLAVAPVHAPTKPVPPVTRATTQKQSPSQAILPDMRQIFEAPFERVTDEVEDAFADRPVPTRFQYTSGLKRATR